MPKLFLYSSGGEKKVEIFDQEGSLDDSLFIIDCPYNAQFKFIINNRNTNELNMNFESDIILFN